MQTGARSRGKREPIHGSNANSGIRLPGRGVSWKNSSKPISVNLYTNGYPHGGAEDFPGNPVGGIKTGLSGENPGQIFERGNAAAKSIRDGGGDGVPGPVPLPAKPPMGAAWVHGSRTFPGWPDGLVITQGRCPLGTSHPELDGKCPRSGSARGKPDKWQGKVFPADTGAAVRVHFPMVGNTVTCAIFFLCHV